MPRASRQVKAEPAYKEDDDDDEEEEEEEDREMDDDDATPAKPKKKKSGPASRKPNSRTRNSKRVAAPASQNDDDDDEEEEGDDDGAPKAKRPKKKKAADDDADAGEASKSLWSGGEWEVKDIVDRKERALAADVPESVPDMASADSDKLLSDVTRYVLFTNLAHRKCTTSKITADVITPSSIKVSPIQRRALMRIVAKRFDDVFGYTLVSTSDAPVMDLELATGDVKQRKPRKKKKKASQDDEDDDEDEGGAAANEVDEAATVSRSAQATDNWILLNLHESSANKERMWKDHPDNALRALAMTVLGLIMLHDGHAPEEELYDRLTGLGLSKPSDEDAKRRNKRKSTFATAKDALKQLEDAGYVQRKKSAKRDAENNPIVEFRYGARAMLEIGLPNVLRFMERMTNVQLSEKDAAGMLAGKQ